MHLGYGDVKCFGGDRSKIDTPHYDRLAAEGIRFTDAHSAAAVCVPSRIAIMTGRFAWRITPVAAGGPMGFIGARFSPDQFTLGRMLNTAGFRCGYIGKWHLGTLMQTTDGKPQGLQNVDFTKPLLHGPKQFGFDYSFILPGSLDMCPYAFVRNGEFVGKVTEILGCTAFPAREGPAAQGFEDWRVLDTLTTEVETFVVRHATEAKAGKPFFLYLALTAPHTPLSPKPAFQGKSSIGVYGDFVMETDNCVGRVMKALQAHGLAENTLVIATSDHGAASYVGRNRKAAPGQVHEMEREGHHPNGIHRGYKFTVYEGGTRVPFIVRWPGVVKAGAQCDRLVGLVDLMRTLADVSGCELRADQAPDSISFLPLLKNADAPPTRASLILQATTPFCVRQGSWKLALSAGSGDRSGLDTPPGEKEAWAAALKQLGHEPSPAELRRAPFVQLFDLSADPAETRSLAASRPEKVEELIALLEKSIADGRSTPGPKLENENAKINILAHP